MEFRFVLPVAAEEVEHRLYSCFLETALSSRQIKLVEASESFLDENSVDSRLEEGTKRRFRVAMQVPSLLGVLLMGLSSSSSSCVFDVEERVSFPFSRSVWKNTQLDLNVEVSMMVLEDERGQHPNALAAESGERTVQSILLAEEEPSGSIFDFGISNKPVFDWRTCSPCCCVYVLAKTNASWTKSLVIDWIVKEPMSSLLRRVVVSALAKEAISDASELERRLQDTVANVSPPIRAKRVVDMDAELVEQVRLAKIIADDRADSLQVTEPARDVSPPMRVKKVEDLRVFGEELAEEIAKLKGPPPRDIETLSENSTPVLVASVPPPVPVRDPDEMALNLSALPPPPLLPDQVRATSPRASMVLLPATLPADLQVKVSSPRPLPASPTATSPRPTECDSPRVAIPLSRKSASDVRPTTSPRATQVSPRTLGRSFKMQECPPPPPPPPAATSPRARSSTVIMDEDLVKQAKQLRPSPPSSPRQTISGHDVYDLLYRKAQELRKSVAKGGDDDVSDDEW